MLLFLVLLEGHVMKSLLGKLNQMPRQEIRMGSLILSYLCTIEPTLFSLQIAAEKFAIDFKFTCFRCVQAYFHLIDSILATYSTRIQN